MIRSVQVQNLEVEPNNFSWTGMLQAVSFAVHRHVACGMWHVAWLVLVLAHLLMAAMVVVVVQWRCSGMVHFGGQHGGCGMVAG